VAERRGVATRQQSGRGVLEAGLWRSADGIDAAVNGVEPAATGDGMVVD
jgi:hypothetical protein